MISVHLIIFTFKTYNPIQDGKDPNSQHLVENSKRFKQDSLFNLVSYIRSLVGISSTCSSTDNVSLLYQTNLLYRVKIY